MYYFYLHLSVPTCLVNFTSNGLRQSQKKIDTDLAYTRVHKSETLICFTPKCKKHWTGSVYTRVKKKNPVYSSVKIWDIGHVYTQVREDLPITTFGRVVLPLCIWSRWRVLSQTSDSESHWILHSFVNLIALLIILVNAYHPEFLSRVFKSFSISGQCAAGQQWLFFSDVFFYRSSCCQQTRTVVGRPKTVVATLFLRFLASILFCSKWRRLISNSHIFEGKSCKMQTSTVSIVSRCTKQPYKTCPPYIVNSSQALYYGGPIYPWI